MSFRLTRRRFFGVSGVAAIGDGLYTWRIEPHWIRVTRQDMSIRNLPSHLENRTLCQISDLHVGPKVDSDYISAALQTVSNLQPDIVVITGDFMSVGSPERVEEVARVVSNLNAPPLGCFAVLGNHDYGERWSDLAIAEVLTQRLTEHGITVLRNTAHETDGLTIVGIDDMWGPNFRPLQVMSKLNTDEAQVVLCHNPDAVDGAVWGSYRGWILSGHTHGGQCKPPFLSPPLLPVLNKRYTSGAFDLHDGRTLYINRGLGHLLRVRFNTRPEITLFRLIRETE